ncbi:hypothetical protein J4G37_46700, partial [Microvirga sp. 3-52]|nr:hypothetical protein [Microvirga sp. 3-52]
MKRILMFIASLALVVAFVLPDTTYADKVIDEKLGVPIVVYGADLSAAERESVEESLDVANEAEVEEVTVDGNDLTTYI